MPAPTNASLAEFHLRARTKIVATVGPACWAPEQLAALIRAGADVFRLNMAHGDHARHAESLFHVRKASELAGRPVAVLVDLAGPKIRLGELARDPLVCDAGKEFRFVRGEASNEPFHLTSNYARLVDELEVGDSVMLADGTVSAVVVAKSEEYGVTCRVIGAGVLRSRQGINLPGAKLSVPALTKADRADAAWAARAGADYVSLSFVRSANEIVELQTMLRALGSPAPVIAKIEKPEALARLEEIVAAADGVMVARGDLGVEIDVAEIPLAQKRIIEVCRRLCKPVIVATQMLDSMHNSRRPTRAEVTDVANAVLDGADACMLSGETAIGQFPLEAVATMTRVMLAAEESFRDAPRHLLLNAGGMSATFSDAGDKIPSSVHPITHAVVQGTNEMLRYLDVRLVVANTRSGGTALVISKQRHFIRTLGVSDSDVTLRKMCLYWGVAPVSNAPCHEGAALRQFIDSWGRAQQILTAGDRVIFVTGTNFFPGAHNVLVVHEVE